MEFRKGVFVKFYRGENHSFGSGVELDLQGYNLLRVRSLPPAVVSAVMHNFFPLVNVQKSEFLSILYLKKTATWQTHKAVCGLCLRGSHILSRRSTRLALEFSLLTPFANTALKFSHCFNILYNCCDLEMC